MKETSQTNRLILAVLAVVIGLFMIAVAPVLIQTSMERVVAALIEVTKTKPQYASGVMLFSFTYPLYRGLIFVGGVMLILFARDIYKGEEWTYPAALLAAAFPSAGGMFMFLPYVSWVEGFPIPIAISMVGLIFFWGMIFLRKADAWLKWGNFLALTFMGMLSTHAFTIGIGNLRMLLTRPEKPLYAGLEWWVLAWSGPVQWICVILLFAGLYLLAARRASGWWLGLIAAASILAIDVPTQVIRTTMSESTSWDYLYGSLLSLGLLFSLLLPRFKAALVAQHECCCKERV
ncbi:MAG: hypothetical protein L0Z70_05015 [Chloroflexi bacterium]|nr:hypothetical protein [Chloroflexota bacterium]